MYAIQIGQKLLLIPIQFHPGATLVNLIDTQIWQMVERLTQTESH